MNDRARTVFDCLRKVREIYLGMVERGELVRVYAHWHKREVRSDILGLIDRLRESRAES